MSHVKKFAIGTFLVNVPSRVIVFKTIDKEIFLFEYSIERGNVFVSPSNPVLQDTLQDIYASSGEDNFTPQNIYDELKDLSESEFLNELVLTPPKKETQ